MIPWFPFAFLSRVVREVSEQFENGQDERHDEETEPEPRLVVDAEGWLQGPHVRHDSSPKWSRSPILESTGPVVIVSHATATPRRDSKGKPIADALLAAIRKSGGREASWHVLVDDDGIVYQSIPFSRGAWHAGSKSAARVIVDGRPTLVNLASIGIEYVNAGEARWCDAEWSVDRQEYIACPGAWRAWPFSGQKPSDGAPKGRGHGPLVPPDELVVVGSRRWHGYTLAQFEARRLIHDALLVRWPQLAHEVTLQHPDGRRVVVAALSCGHVDVDPVRKADPYPTFTVRRVA